MGKVGLSWLTKTPIAHRGFHCEELGVWENSRSAILAAIENGYAIEIDLQLSNDRQAMVFHDFTLDRMTDRTGEFRDLDAQELKSISLMAGNDRIWTFSELLETVDGKVPLIVELKGRQGMDGGFMASVGNALEDYSGEVAVMSFAHWLVLEAKQLLPNRPIGLTTEGDDRFYNVHNVFSKASEPEFISHKHTQLSSQFVREFRNTGMPVICWTVKSVEQAEEAYKMADQITFEGFAPAIKECSKV